MAQPQIKQHWPVVALILAVTVVFLVALFFYQVEQTEYAVVRRFNKPLETRNTEPGLHPRWPWPIEDVWKVDNRVHVFEGKTGQIEEVFTADGNPILMTLFVVWRVDGPGRILFMERVDSKDKAEELLTGLLRSCRLSVITQYPFSSIVNIDPAKIRTDEMEQKILDCIAEQARTAYGIKVAAVGFKHIGLPEDATTKVFERMRAERQRFVEEITSAGKTEADKIAAEADMRRDQLIFNAEREAQGIRAKGDAMAAGSYEIFRQDPELATFLLQLEYLRRTLKDKTTLVLDTNTPPFTIFSEKILSDLKDKKPKSAKRD